MGDGRGPVGMADVGGRRQTALVANIGNRDLALNIHDAAHPWWVTLDKSEDGQHAQKFLRSNPGTRAMAAVLAARLDEFRDRLALPILEPAIHLVLQELGRLDRVLLFATDQPESAGAHRDWDTVESARVVRAMLRERYQARIGDIEISRIGFNPSEHDRVYEFVGVVLRQLFPPASVRLLAACIKGGVPAQNAALRTHAVNLYGARAWLVETEEPPAAGRSDGVVGAARLVDTWPFRRDTLARVLRELVRHHNYDAARYLLASEDVRLPALEAVLRHAQARLNLDFEGAADALRDQTDPHLVAWRTSAARARATDRLAEVATAAIIAVRRGDLVGFVTRAASFCETCRRGLVEVITKAELGPVFDPTSVPDEARRASLVAFLRRRSGLERAPGEADHWFVKRPLLNAMLGWAREWMSPGDRERVKRVQERLKELKALEELRNDALHLAQGISWRVLKARVKDPEETFAGIAGEVVEDVRQLALRFQDSEGAQEAAFQGGQAVEAISGRPTESTSWSGERARGELAHLYESINEWIVRAFEATGRADAGVCVSGTVRSAVAGGGEAHQTGEGPPPACGSPDEAWKNEAEGWSSGSGGGPSNSW